MSTTMKETAYKDLILGEWYWLCGSDGSPDSIAYVTTDERHYGEEGYQPDYECCLMKRGEVHWNERVRFFGPLPRPPTGEVKLNTREDQLLDWVEAARHQ